MMNVNLIFRSLNLPPNIDKPVGGRFAGIGVSFGEGREEKSTGAAQAGAEKGGEGACSQATTEGATSQERGRPICCVQNNIHSQDHQLRYGVKLQQLTRMRKKNCLWLTLWYLSYSMGPVREICQNLPYTEGCAQNSSRKCGGQLYGRVRL